MTEALIDHFRMLADYNRRANARLYEACGRLPAAERTKVRPAFFKSIHGTLNHIMVGDRIWLGRFEGREMTSSGLDSILYEDFAELCRARRAEDDRIEAFAEGLTVEFLGGTIGYRNHEGRSFEDPAALVVAHLFNHQTHHRGQVHDMLCQTELPPPSLDMHRVLRPDPID